MKRKTLSHRSASCLFRNVDSTPSASVLFKFRSTLFKFVQDKKIPPSANRAPQNVDSIAGPPCLFTFCSPLFTFVHDKKNSPEKLARPKSRLSSIRTPASRIRVLGRMGASPTFVSPPSEFFQMRPLHPLRAPQKIIARTAPQSAAYGFLFMAEKTYKYVKNLWND